MTAVTKVLVSVSAMLGGLTIVLVALGVLFLYRMSSTVMTKSSPDGKHFAKLTRVDGIDLIFNVSVDGKHVYQSPDFAPTAADCREQVVWASDSQAVVLLVAEQRLFGYNVKKGRSLTNSELLDVRVPQIADLGFEGTLPIPVVQVAR